MLTIEHCDIEESVVVGSFFNDLGFRYDSEQSDESGDSYVKNNWAIDVLSLDGYYRVDGFRWTKPEKQMKFFVKGRDFESNLTCSPEHVVLNSNLQWLFVKDLKVGHQVVTKNGLASVVKIEDCSNVERLCDLQVDIAHSYYTNDIMSHNSHFLTFLGANALRAGVDVLHYTFELSEAAVGRRYDSNLCDIDSSDIIDKKEEVLEKYKTSKLGRLMIKEFPTNTATIYTLRSHIERLDLKGFRPGLIIIDYADIMRSTRQYDSLRHELKLIYEELRGFASEKSIPIWSASQSNKEGSTADIVDLSNMSEAYGKAMVADVVVSLSRKSHEKSKGWGRLYIAKNRAGRDGIVYPIKIDTSKSKFEIAGEILSFDESKSDDEKTLKNTLRAKWKELQNEPKFQKHEVNSQNQNSGTGENE